MNKIEIKTCTGRKVVCSVVLQNGGFTVSAKKRTAFYSWGEYGIFSSRDAAETAVLAGDVG